MSNTPAVAGGLAVVGLAVIGGIAVYNKGFNKGHGIGYAKGHQQGYSEGELQATTRYESQMQAIRTDYENKIRELEKKLKAKE